MTLVLIIMLLAFLTGIVTAMSLARSSAESDRRLKDEYEQMIRDDCDRERDLQHEWTGV